MTLEESMLKLAKEGINIKLEHQFDQYNDKLRSINGKECKYDKSDIYEISSWINTEHKITHLVRK